MRSIAIAALALIAGACVSSPGAQAEPRWTNPPGPYVHRGSGFVFPTSVGEFQRISVTLYDADEMDVSAAYRSGAEADRITVTVYVYPAPPIEAAGLSKAALVAAQDQACAQHFESMMNDVVQFNPSARRVELGALASPSPTHMQPGRKAVFSFERPFAGLAQKVRSEADLFCYVDGQWLIAYRTTAAASADSEPALARLMRELKWPEGR